MDASAGARAAAELRRHLAAGDYRDLRDGAEMAGPLTSDLQASIPDRHLQVRWSEQERAPSETSDWDDPEYGVRM